MLTCCVSIVSDSSSNYFFVFPLNEEDNSNTEIPIYMLEQTV